MAEASKVAERVRVYRERLKMTTAELADQAGVSEGVVSAIEAGEVYPALGVLVKLSRALGQRLGTFMDDQFCPDPVIVRAETRSDGGIAHRAVSSEGFTYHPLAHGKTDRHMEPFQIDIAAGAPSPLSSHEGEEFIVVTSGEVELVYGDQTQRLKIGDSAYYNSVVQHRVKAANGAPASIYAVVFVPC